MLACICSSGVRGPAPAQHAWLAQGLQQRGRSRARRPRRLRSRRAAPAGCPGRASPRRSRCAAAADAGQQQLLSPCPCLRACWALLDTQPQRMGLYGEGRGPGELAPMHARSTHWQLQMLPDRAQVVPWNGRRAAVHASQLAKQAQLSLSNASLSSRPPAHAAAWLGRLARPRARPVSDQLCAQEEKGPPLLPIPVTARKAEPRLALTIGVTGWVSTGSDFQACPAALPCIIPHAWQTRLLPGAAPDSSTVYQEPALHPADGLCVMLPAAAPARLCLCLPGCSTPGAGSPGTLRAGRVAAAGRQRLRALHAGLGDERAHPAQLESHPVCHRPGAPCLPRSHARALPACSRNTPCCGRQPVQRRCRPRISCSRRLGQGFQHSLRHSDHVLWLLQLHQPGSQSRAWAWPRPESDMPP